jgi:mannose-6-phosphate isomerase-like protein (cupin superfamily)
MQAAGDVLKLTPSETVEIRSSAREALEVEGNWGPEGSAPPKHFHPAQDEHFEILAGTLRARVDGEQRDLGPGEQLEIPSGAVHQMWNPGSEPARALWRTSPAGRTEQWFRAVDSLHREGRTGPLAFGVLLSEYDDVFRLAAAPAPLVRPAVAVLGALGRARGHSAQA